MSSHGAAVDPWAEMADELAELKDQKRLRQRSLIDGKAGRQVVWVDGQGGGRRHKLINWASNDYAGLAQDRRVINGAARALRSYGAGATGSRLLGGGLRCHRRLEQRLAQWLGVDDCLVTTTGYQANLALLVALANSSEDVVIVDRLAHASTYDGIRLSAASLLRFAHNDLEDLERKLALSVASRRRLVCVESVYSMDGDEAPLRAIAEICARHQALLVVDEDHALGVLGPGGRGLCAELGVQPAALVGTCSKGLGAQGGFIAASQTVVDLVVNRGRSFIFSTAPVPAAMGAAVAALDVLRREPDIPERIQAQSAQLRAALAEQGWSVPAGRSAIIPVLVGDEQRSLDLALALRQAGHYAPAIRPPTVPAAGCRLRLNPSLAHTKADLRRLIAAFAELQTSRS
ncbi:MAG: 8-amino-7-oxononanoate synthase [Planctomycetota bacterium]|nr:MAG: 8-amino-7-oxononanoate synthase [Planctomycetota bacterium]